MELNNDIVTEYSWYPRSTFPKFQTTTYYPKPETMNFYNSFALSSKWAGIMFLSSLLQSSRCSIFTFNLIGFLRSDICTVFSNKLVYSKSVGSKIKWVGKVAKIHFPSLVVSKCITFSIFGNLFTAFVLLFTLLLYNLIVPSSDPTT